MFFNLVIYQYQVWNYNELELSYWRENAPFPSSTFFDLQLWDSPLKNPAHSRSFSGPAALFLSGIWDPLCGSSLMNSSTCGKCDQLGATAVTSQLCGQHWLPTRLSLEKTQSIVMDSHCRENASLPFFHFLRSSAIMGLSFEESSSFAIFFWARCVVVILRLGSLVW